MKETAAINWQQSLKLAGDREDIAQSMLDSFMSDLPNAWNDIQNARNNNDLEGLHHHVHKLHGAACFCGVPLIKALVSEIETQIKLKKPMTITDVLLIHLKNTIEATQEAYNNGSYRDQR